MPSSSNPEEPQVVIYRPGTWWSQFDLGTDFDATSLSVIAELDPTGSHGVVEQVLGLFRESLEPTLQLFEQLRRGGNEQRIRFEAHKLYSAAGQVGALRLARACRAISAHYAERERGVADPTELAALLDDLVYELVRVQRRLHQLLSEDDAA